jgi:signal transduction histidine kinase
MSAIDAEARAPASGAAASHPVRRGLPLATRFALAFLGLVSAVLTINGAIDMVLSWREATRQAFRVQQEKADAAASRVAQFVAEIEGQMGWTTRAEWARLPVDQRRYDFIRLLRQAPAITELIQVDGQGREQLKLSRLEPDAVGSNVDLSADPRVAGALRDRIWYGPVTFRRGSEPYMAIGIGHVGRNAGATIAEVNLKLAWDVVTGIRVGETGYAFVTDLRGRLIAHPDMSLVLRDTDLSRLPQVAAAIATAGREAGATRVVDGVGPDGQAELSAFAAVPKIGWFVFVDLPRREAFAAVWKALYQTLALLSLGIGLAGVAGTLLARRLSAPIRDLRAGAEQLGRGDLASRIPVKRSDEIGALATSFNVMAERIQEAQATLEKRVEERTADLNEALEQQTATADVLKVISRSVFDLQPVLRTLIDTAVRLCRGSRGTIYLRDGDVLRAAAFHNNVPQELKDHLMATPIRLDEDRALTRSFREGKVIHIEDFNNDPLTSRSVAPLHARFGSMLYVPLIRDGEPVGCLTMPREQVKPFSPREIELVQTFADQAVIAIENSRLFEEVQARTKELQESLEYQMATSEVLGVISRSAANAQPVFEAIVRSAATLFAPWSANISIVRDGMLHFMASAAADEADSAVIKANVEGIYPLPLDPERAPSARAILERTIIELTDTTRPETPEASRRVQAATGFRSMTFVPLLREDEGIGTIILTNREPGHRLTEKQRALVQTFADQAVIAIDNANLFEQVQARTRELQGSLDDLRAAQDRLVQSEKLASLGQLTAGIAHEIKNPLNFVNNFADLSRELVGELEELMEKSADAVLKAEAREITEMLRGNLEKVVTHGKRADSIVRNMLAHSRKGGDERRVVDLNTTVEEALNLAYHGARAERPGFNVTLERDLDPSAGRVELYPQEFTRVLLNLIGNGFHAVEKKRRESAAPGFEPTLTISTRAAGDKIRVMVRDNGTGMPDHVKAHIFEPFFTTKPTGEGTGLGLSLSHDIVVKQHGGEIAVETSPGEFTAFTVTLPRGATAPTGAIAP